VHTTPIKWGKTAGGLSFYYSDVKDLNVVVIPGIEDQSVNDLNCFFIVSVCFLSMTPQLLDLCTPAANKIHLTQKMMLVCP